MTTYLTPEEFSRLFFYFYRRKMTGLPKHGVADKILWMLFQAYEKDIRQTLEGALWNIGECPETDAINIVGPQFQKSFRQTDVIEDKHIDGIIWISIGDADIFWLCLNKACKVLTSKDAAEIYKDELDE